MAAPVVEGFQRIVMLNHLISRSTSHAPAEVNAPALPGLELFDIIEKRRQKKWAIEYLGVREEGDSDDERVSKGIGHDFIRLRQFRIEERANRPYVIMLFEYVDQSQRSFPVVDTLTFDGREIAGEREERGAAAAHVVVRLPGSDDYDDRRYRCAIEAVHSMTRSNIEHFLCRQLRRQSVADEMRFTVAMPSKGRKKASDREYRFTPKLELMADAGRKLAHASSDGKALSHMTFTKRGERESLGRETEVTHKDVIADVEYKVLASQGPDGKEERRSWVDWVRTEFKSRGFEEHLYFRHLKGAMLSGKVHQDLAGASDLLMCPKDLIFLSKEPKKWHPTINRETVDQMLDLLDKDGLWERSK